MRSMKEMLRDAGRGYKNDDTVCVKSYISGINAGINGPNRDMKRMAKDGWCVVAQSGAGTAKNPTLVTYERSV
jgi:hypothetical protein